MQWSSRARPARAPLEGRYCRLEPLEPQRHGEQLFEASMAPGAEERFRYLFESPQPRKEFEGWLARSAASEDPLYFGVIDIASGRCEGRQALMRIVPEHGVIEIGSILWGPAIART
ncbi:MAG: GNAT family N-acetyltransferase, partial [Burkholderiales bacterium]